VRLGGDVRAGTGHTLAGLDLDLADAAEHLEPGDDSHDGDDEHDGDRRDLAAHDDDTDDRTEADDSPEDHDRSVVQPRITRGQGRGAAVDDEEGRGADLRRGLQ
jgi:hypothetical protein